MLRLIREEQGQVFAFTVVAMVCMLGMAALVLDVGSWFRADRKLQAVADASALAGVQELPYDPAFAITRAVEYAGKNDGGGVKSTDISVSSKAIPNDQITVDARESAPGFFSNVFDVFSVEVAATATAQISNIGSAKWVVPIVVHEAHPMLVCGPCFDETTEIPLAKLKGEYGEDGNDGSGAFGLINLEGSGNGSVGTSTLAAWMLNGYNGYLPLGVYDSVPGAKFNSSQFQSALEARIGDEVLLPVFDTLIGQGSNAQYNVIAWVGFVPESFWGQGTEGALTGKFVKVIWDGIPSTDPAQPFLGARTVSLVS